MRPIASIVLALIHNVALGQEFQFYSRYELGESDHFLGMIASEPYGMHPGEDG